MTRSRGLTSLLPFFATACAIVNTTSQRAPGIAPRDYARVLVAAATPDLRLRQQVESIMVRSAGVATVDFLPYYKVFLPGEQYADSVFLREIREKNIAAILILADATADAPTVTASVTAIPLCYVWVGARCAQQGAFIASRTGTRQDNFTIASALFDVDSARVVWIGSTRINRNGATDSDMIWSFADNVVTALGRDGVLRGRPKSSR